MSNNINKTMNKRSKASKELKTALAMINHSSVCDLFIKVSTMTLICYDIEKSLMYYWNSDTTIYTRIGIKELATIVSRTLQTFLAKEMKDVEFDALQNYGKLIKSVGNFNFVENVAKLLCGTC